MSNTKTHPLYLTKINKNEKSLLIPEYKNNNYIFSKKNIKNENIVNSKPDEILTLDMDVYFLFAYNLKGRHERDLC